MTWTKLPSVDPGPNPCLCCPDPLAVLSMDSIVNLGHIRARLERDGEIILNGEDPKRMASEDYLTVQECEDAAAKDPDHDWRIVKFGPLHGEVYQRHDAAQWVCIERNEGFY